jgi:putative NADPH-quinone reductase
MVWPVTLPGRFAATTAIGAESTWDRPSRGKAEPTLTVGHRRGAGHDSMPAPGRSSESCKATPDREETTAMTNLFIFGHPDLASDSFMSAEILATVREELQPGSGIWLLNQEDELVSSSNETVISAPFDIPLIQSEMEKHAGIVLVFPYHWYSMPYQLKRFVDEVFTYEWSYAASGRMALRDKKLYLLTTLGAGQADHQRGGFNHYSVAESLLPLRMTANITAMQFMEPWVIYGNSTLWGVLWDKIQLDDNAAFLEEQRNRVRAEARRYLDAIAAGTVRAIPLQEDLAQ